MSTRAHFWFRILALAAILLAEFGPRMLSGLNGASSVSTARVIAASAP